MVEISPGVNPKSRIGSILDSTDKAFAYAYCVLVV